jgi:hypothetical protein
VTVQVNHDLLLTLDRTSWGIFIRHDPIIACRPAAWSPAPM